MNNVDLNALFVETSQKVTTCCDNEHVHTALKNCLVPRENVGDERDVIICKLCELIFKERGIAKELLSKITGEL